MSDGCRSESQARCTSELNRCETDMLSRLILYISKGVHKTGARPQAAIYHKSD